PGMYPYETPCDSPMHVPTPCKLGVMGRTSRCDTCWSSARQWREQEICQTACRRFPCLPARTVWCYAARVGCEAQATRHWVSILVQRVILLPPDAGEGWDGGRVQSACGQILHPHPRPPPSQGEGRLCAKLMGSNLVVPYRSLTQTESISHFESPTG